MTFGISFSSRKSNISDICTKSPEKEVKNNVTWRRMMGEETVPGVGVNHLLNITLK